MVKRYPQKEISVSEELREKSMIKSNNVRFMKKKQIYEPPVAEEIEFDAGLSILFDFSVEGDFIDWGDNHTDGGGSSAEIWKPGGRV